MSRTTIFFAAGLERCCCASNQASALPLTGAQSIEVVAPYLTEGRMGRRAKLVGEFLPRGRKAPCHQEREHREHLDGVPPPLRRVCQVFNGKAVAHCEHKRGLAKSVDTWRLSMCTVADRRASTRYARPRAHDKRTPCERPPPQAQTPKCGLRRTPRARTAKPKRRPFTSFAIFARKGPLPVVPHANLRTSSTRWLLHTRWLLAGCWCCCAAAYAAGSSASSW